MAKPDCPICESLGLRSCDRCGLPMSAPSPVDAQDQELCAVCLDELAAAAN